jgi:hypothetical protein
MIDSLIHGQSRSHMTVVKVVSDELKPTLVQFGVERRLARAKSLPEEHVDRVAAGLTSGLTASSEGEEA